MAWAAAISGLSAGSGRVWLTDSTAVTRPPSIRMYAVLTDSITPAGFNPSRHAALFGIGPRRRPAVIFECVGVPGVVNQIMEGAPAGARIVVVGVCMQTDQFEPFFGIVKQLDLQFVLAYTARNSPTPWATWPRAASTRAP